MSAPPLPHEIVRLILDSMDDLDFEGILALGHVARTWRAAARTHPFFARDISLASVLVEYQRGIGRSVSSGALHLFLDRLTASPVGRLNLDIFLCELTGVCGVSGARLGTVVAQALRDCLPRLVRLTLRCDHGLVPDLLAALCAGPAPRLTVFEFLTPEWGRYYTRDELPIYIFAGSAPLLRVLQMDACMFPPRAVPAFAAVRVLTREVDRSSWDSGVRDLQPELFFSCCPALQGFTIDGNDCPLKEEKWDLCTASSTRNLRRLTVSGSFDIYDTEVIINALAHAAMLDIQVPMMTCDGPISLLMISHLDDSPTLELEIVHEMSWSDPLDLLLVHCCVYDASRRRRRTFTHHSGEMTELDEFELVEWALRPSFVLNAHRFTSITLPGTEECWSYLIMAFGGEVHLVNMQCLTIVVTEDGSLFAGEQLDDLEDTLVLPVLSQIKLVSDEEVDVEMDDLIALFQDTIDIPDGQTVHLELLNVTLIGDTVDELEGYVELEL